MTMRLYLRSVLFLLTFAAVLQAAQAHETQHADHQNHKGHKNYVTDGEQADQINIVISRPWLLETPPGVSTGGGYVTLFNRSGEPDRLIAAHSAKAGHIEIHEMKVTDGVMTMRLLDEGIALPAGASVDLQPGGKHLMLFNLDAPLKVGDKVRIKLVFERAGAITTVFDIKPHLTEHGRKMQHGSDNNHHGH
ncbi:copper chaperone PCu(A)C [Brucella gallinifaecis]|uniref:Copper chaperone PCu(A)C n=1 Tax=Brucella gallinifaecis TaxID=215590 RepID=A0A502BVG6_9HYPH|nr:copper chaperone PCu(A)C [Brucella gallinifaecis]